MTIKRLLFEGGTDGLDATNANAGTSLINRAGGIIKFDAAAAAHGLLGLRLESTATAQYTIARATSAAANNQMAFEAVFKYNGAGAGGAPTAELNFLMIRNSINDSGVARLVVKTNNAFEVRDGVNTPIPGSVVVLVPGTRYRVAMVMTGGSATVGVINAWLYDWDGTTPLGSWSSTTANMTANPIGGVELGIVSQNQAAYVGVDDVQFDDGRTTQIGPYDPNANEPPIVTAGPSQTVAVGSTVNVTSTATDPGGSIASRLWTFDYYPPALGSAPAITNADQADASFVPSAAGLYTLRITATDNLGGASFATTKVFVPGLPVTVIADTANPGNWVDVGAAPTLWQAISDNSDATWAESPEAPLTEATYRARLAPLPVLTNVSLTLRHKLSAAGSGTAKVRLIEGGAVRKEWTVTPSETLGSVVLTMAPAECATVTNWNELDLEVSWVV